MGNAIRIPLPQGMEVADTDGDGSITDEISLDGNRATATGYTAVTGSTANTIRIVSASGGQVGPVHVQFPVQVPAAPGVATASYGAVTFTKAGEQTIPAGTVTVAYVAPTRLQLATPSTAFADGAADTTTSRAGSRYPDAAQAVFPGRLPDLARDDQGQVAGNLLGALGRHGNGDDGDDAAYGFWLSSTDSLARVDTSTAMAAIDAATGLPARAAEGDSASLAFDVSGLDVGTYYLYVTSDLTGTFPLVRSRGIGVVHEPTVLQVGQVLGGDPDWIDSGRLLNLDTGAPGPEADARDALSIPVSVVDHDDTASVRLFYSATADLDTADVVTTGSAPNRVLSALTGAAHVDAAVTLLEGVDSTLTWRVGPDDDTVVAAGDYYLYAVITDGTSLSIGRSDTLFHVRHSPFLRLDARVDRRANTGGTTPERYVAITWNQDHGIDGDFDRDGSEVIDLYYSAEAFAVPGGADSLAAAAADPDRDTHRIVGGLAGTPDGRSDNQYQWDLWSYRNTDDGGVPRPGQPYELYGVVTADGTSRVVRWEDGTGAARTVEFEHDPYLRLRAPQSAIAIDGRRSFEVAWEAVDVDDEARLWVILAPAAETAGLAATTWLELTAAATRAWNASSADGSLASGVALSEETAVSHTVRPATLTSTLDGDADPIVDGDYAVYVVIDADAGATPADGSLAVRAPGIVTIDGFGEDGAVGLSAPAIEVLPARSAADAWRDTTVLSIRPHSDGETVDLVSVFLSVDTLLVDVVDQDPDQAGTQPFSVDPGLTGLTLFDSVTVGTDSIVAGQWLMDLVYFEQAGTVFDGLRDLATVTLASKNRTGTTTLRVDNLARRRSAFYRNGDEVGRLAPTTEAQIAFLPRSTISGNVRLQGRELSVAGVTLFLRDRNSFEPLNDSLFAAVNDRDSTRAGIQDTLDSFGAYSLQQVPRGFYHLAVHVDRYLDGQVPSLDVRPGSQLTGVDPHYRADGTLDAPFLIGGDVTGWVDTAGAVSPDNEIDQQDVDFVTAFFGQTITAGHAGALADIDADSVVWVPDLNMVAANFGLTGVEPSYRPAAPPAPASLRLAVDAAASGRTTVSVRGDALPQVRAFGLSLAYDAAHWRPVRHDGRRLFGGRPAVDAFHEGDGVVQLGGALLGSGATAVDAGQPLAHVDFEPTSPVASAAGFRLLTADLIDGAHRVRRAAIAAGPPRPDGYALHPAFPNPFNPRTALTVDLPERSRVQLAIYDAAGQRVRVLTDGSLPAGSHVMRWDGSDADGLAVASGVYFARLTAPAFRAERKMLLLR